jgi:putative flippase GtrA
VIISARQFSKATIRKLVSFLAVGAAASAAYSAICVISVHFYPAYKYVISIAAFVAMIPAAFFGQRIFTFRSRAAISHEFLLYAGLQVASIVVSTMLIGSFITENPFLNLVIFLIIAGVAAIISFLFCNLVVFRQSRSDKGLSMSLVKSLDADS